MSAPPADSPSVSSEQLPDNAILVARSMGPAALLDYDRKRLRGLVLEEGGPTSHVSIVARALGIPTVGEIENATGLVEPATPSSSTASTGDVHMRPPPDIETAYGERVKLRARRQAQYRALRDKPCVTKDGKKITLMINAGLLIDLPHIEETGAAGIGLFRTELQFMVATAFPRTSEQLSLYRAVLDAAGEQAGDFPHARHRRRQGAALYAQRRGGKSRARLARDPARPRPARACCAARSARCCAPPADANCASCSR